MTTPLPPAAPKQPKPQSSPANTPTATPAVSTPSAEAELVQVDRLSTLPQELQHEIIDWVAPSLLSAESKALGLASKILHQTLENHQEMQAPELVKFSLRRFDQALACLPSLPYWFWAPIYFVMDSEQLNAALQKCAAETDSPHASITLVPPFDKNLLNEEGLAAFRNYEGRQLSIKSISKDNIGLPVLKRIAEVIPKSVLLQISFGKYNDYDPAQLKQLFDVLRQRSLLTSLYVVNPENMPVESQALLMDFLSGPNPVSHLILGFTSEKQNEYLDVFAKSLPKFNQLPLLMCRFNGNSPDQQTLDRCIAAVSEHNRSSALPLTVIFESSNLGINYSNQPFSTEESLENCRNNGIHFGSSGSGAPKNIGKEVETSLIRARDSYLAKSSLEKN